MMTINRNMLAQFENQALDVCTGVVLRMKKLHFISRNWCKGNVACEFSPIKIHYSDYPKQINEVYVFFNIIPLFRYFIEST